MFKKLLAGLLLCSGLAFGQSAHLGNNPDNGPTLPVKCTLAQIYKLTAMDGANPIGLYSCDALNVWTYLESENGGGNLTGTLTATHIPVATASDVLGDSSTTDDGANLTFSEPTVYNITSTDPVRLYAALSDQSSTNLSMTGVTLYEYQIIPNYTDTGSGNIWYDIALSSTLDSSGGGTPASYNALSIGDTVSGGTLTTYNDIDASSLESAVSTTVVNWNAFNVQDILSTQTNYYGLHLQADGTTGKTVTNFYGIYIKKPTHGTFTHPYSIVTEANTGNFGIGTTTPTQALDVVGNVQASAALMSTGVAFSSLPSPTVGMLEYCSDCQVTTAATCSTATPASCVCKASGNGAFARYMNYQGGGANWYCQ